MDFFNLINKKRFPVTFKKNPREMKETKNLWKLISPVALLQKENNNKKTAGGV